MKPTGLKCCREYSRQSNTGKINSNQEPQVFVGWGSNLYFANRLKEINFKTDHEPTPASSKK